MKNTTGEEIASSPRRRGPMPRNRGLSLVELLISLALGLLVAAAAGSVLVSANTSFSSQAEAAAIDDAGRFALELIARSVRQTAYTDLDREDAGELAATMPARLDGADAATVTRDSAGIDKLRDQSVNGSDVLALRFAGSGAPPDGDGSVVSCAGFPVHALEDGWSIFYVATSATGATELRCKYRTDKGWAADAVLAGVDTFQVLYGIDTDVPVDGVANRYVSATVIRMLDAALPTEGETALEREQHQRRHTQWRRVTAIKVALLLHGRERSGMSRELTEYALFGKGYSDEQDVGSIVREASLPEPLRYRERRLFGTTVVLRNPAL